MPWRVAETDLDRIKREIDLVALARSRGIGLVRRETGDFIGRCPFHDDQDKTSFVVTPAQRMWHCKACGREGNVIQFVQHHDGISFRHAFELLTEGQNASFRTQPMLQQNTVPKLSCPLDVKVDDATLLQQVASYYHQRLKSSETARTYLAGWGLDSPEMIDHFQIGLADRSLGLRLPEKNRKEGDRLRSRLMQLGLWRKSGHEHFNGCIVVPLQDATGNVAGFAGGQLQRDLNPLPGLQRGRFNQSCLTGAEIILCGNVFAALTLWVHGFRHATCLPAEVFPDELWVSMNKVRRVYLAYGADEAGERTTRQHAEQFQARGIEVFRLRFPPGMDAKEYARRFQPAAKSLAVLINAAQWLGSSVSSPATAASIPSVADMEIGAEKKAADPQPKIAAPGDMFRPNPAGLELRGDVWFLALEGREYRVSGLSKPTGPDALKIGLRLRCGDQFYLDQIDLSRDADRRRFMERAAEETGLTTDLLKRDLGRLLLAVEQAQVELSKPQKVVGPTVTLSPEERAAALAWLRAPNLIQRLRADFQQAGIVGEENNALVIYLAGVSRKLEQPLAVIIQSASAAGKTTLMDAMLSFFPEEECVKYSAMTGQSLYYLGETSLKHKILAVVEETGAHKATYALKLLQSEGELTIASTGKDPATGRLVTQEYHVAGPVMIFLTTTAIDLDEELQNRCVTLAVDESSDQTARIHQRQRERRTLVGLAARTERTDLLHKLRNAQRLLRHLNVLNPYAPGLLFPTLRTRNRRDHEKYLTLIDAIALLHQHQREIKTLPVTKAEAAPLEYIEVTLEDIALANQLAPEMMSRDLDELPPQTRRLLGHIRELAQKQCGAKSSSIAVYFSRKELRNLCGWSLTQVRVHLDRLVALEYLAVRFGRLGRQFVYELLLDSNAPESVAHIGLIDVAKLKHNYVSNLAGFEREVAGQNSDMTASGGPPTPLGIPLNISNLEITRRPGRKAHQEHPPVQSSCNRSPTPASQIAPLKAGN